MDTYDVTVVGARAGGAATAMLLARQGLRVLVLDRDRYGTDTLSTHALMRGGVLLLSQWGVLNRIKDAHTPPLRQTRFHYGADTVTVTIKPTLGVDALYAPRRTVLDRILVDAASEAGADIRYGVTVTGVRRDEAGQVIGVVGRDRAGALVETRSWLTVGADGARSTVATPSVTRGCWRRPPAVLAAGWRPRARPGGSTPGSGGRGTSGRPTAPVGRLSAMPVPFWTR